MGEFIITRPPQQKSIIIDVGEPIASSFEQVTVNNSSTALTTIPTNATGALIQVDSANIRWTDDGTAPTSSSGIQVFQTNTIQLNTATQLSNFRAIRTASTNAILNVLYYKK